MPPQQLGPADTVRILVATDNHVGAHELDPERGNDSWRSFEEVFTIAQERDVDMVLLAGDLFHDNKPSRQAMYQVMRILRANCLGEKPCELQMVSDKTEAFEGIFDHVNYEDPDINVSLPVFSIHGNHDDPSGTKMLASLDLLQISGLINYYGRTPESDNIEIKPVLLQKGRTKIGLYGMSNVRDERLYRTFRDGKVKFFRPTVQQTDWFNIMSVHQNHHAYTEKGYLPEEFLPSFMDLVVWGHEHECKISPTFNPEMGFHVMQPGSSIATSLSQGETVDKHVALVTVMGKKFDVEPIRLKTVRPFKMKEIVLMDDPVGKKVVKKENNRPELTRRLTEIVESMILQARQEWLEGQDENANLTIKDAPKPLIRLRVEYTAPEGSKFDLENPRRFSNRFQDRIANRDDIVQFHRRKKNTSLKSSAPTMPDPSFNGDTTISTAKVEKLVKEFLEAQSLTILPQNSFGDAVAQFIDKDDRHAIGLFVQESLKSQVGYLLDLDKEDEEEEREGLMNELQHNKSRLEDLFAKGLLKTLRKGRLKPKPDGWDTDIDGDWADQPGAMIISDLEDNEDEDEEEVVPKSKPAAGKGKARGGTKSGPKKTAPAKKAPAAKTKGRKKKVEEEEDEDEDEEEEVEEASEEEEDNNVMILDDDDDEEEGLFVSSKPATRGKKAAPAAPAPAPAKKTVASRPVPARTTRRTMTRSVAPQASQQSSIAGWAKGKSQAVSKDEPEEISDDEDDDEAFEPMKPTRRR